MREIWILQPARMRRVLIQKSRHDERACVVVGRIALACIGYGKDCMLQHARVIGHPQHVRGVQHRQVIGSAHRRIVLVGRPRL